MIKQISLFGSRLKYGLIQAPLAGYSTSPFRRWLKRHGAEVTFSEMISADGLLRVPEKQKRYFEFHDDERPIALQLFGSDAGNIAGAVKILLPLRPEIIDLNMACPVRKVVRRGSGAALLEKPDQAYALAVAACEAAGDIPVTVKCRLDSGHGVGLAKLLKRFAEAGVTAVTLHPRTMKQAYRGTADRQAFRELAADSPLPLIYSGDIKSGAETPAVYEQTDAAALMIGRAAIGNPWIFEEARAALAGETYQPPAWKAKVKELLAFRDDLLVLFGEGKGVLEIRKFVGHFLRGQKGARRFVQDFYKAKDPVAQDKVLAEFLETVDSI